MRFAVSAELGYDVRSSGTLILNIHALRTSNQIILDETLIIEPDIFAEELLSPNGENRFIRLAFNQPTYVNIYYRATVDVSYKTTLHSYQHDDAVAYMNADVLPYLYPSRYCQSDKLFRIALNKFGDIVNPFEKVTALTNWIYQNVTYLSGYTTAQTSAYDTMAEQAGVCRDFAHLGIALCRALTIPARYFTGYAYNLFPADFHACFEAYLGGNWIVFDATKLCPLNGFVKIASGRDAADTAVANIFGDINFTYMNANCELLDTAAFEPFYYDSLSYTGISYS